MGDNMLFYDFEVFKHWWCIVIGDTTQRKTSVIDARDALEVFYNNHTHDLWCGYNSRGYDQYILKGILLGYNPKKVNDHIIKYGLPAWKFSGDFRKIDLHNYDAIIKRAGNFIGLKELEYHMGDSIVECDIDFDLDRPLTDEEKRTVIKYCMVDVEKLMKVFLLDRKTFDAKFGLAKMYNLPLSVVDSTPAAITAKILKADRTEDRDDEFDFFMPLTARINKYTHVVDWYLKDKPKYGDNLTVKICGLDVTFGLGGFHGAKEKYVTEGFILDSDVKSLYPNLVIEYLLHSRNIPDKYVGMFESIVNERLRLKALKDPKQESMKLIINAMTGSMGDVNNKLYDPLMRNEICIFGQILMLDLIERIEEKLAGKFELIQLNTDGLFIKLNNESLMPVYEEVCHEWENRVGLQLEHDRYVKMIQKDVNNYIAIKPEGAYKNPYDRFHRKGAYVKELSDLDHELAIVNKAIVDYFCYDIDPSDTMAGCDDLYEYQMLAKKSSNYQYLMHGNDKLPHKYYRIFASSDPTDAGLYKVGSRGTKEKVANSPKNCFIYNEQVTGVKCPQKLNKQYYADMAWSRIIQYLGYDPRQMRLF